MNKKNIISLVSTLVILGLIVLSVYPTTSKSSSSEKKEETPVATSYADGVYEGEGTGMDTITAKVTVEGGKITAVELTGDGETPNIGGAALEELQEQIIAANGAEIDGVSGATVTTTGVQEAVNAALANAASSSSSSSAELTDGTYEGEGTGMGKITVKVTVEGGKITTVEINGDEETPNIGGAALEELQEQIIEANGADIDGVSGATVTTTGVQEAVNDALQ